MSTQPRRALLRPALAAFTALAVLGLASGCGADEPEAPAAAAGATEDPASEPGTEPGTDLDDLPAVVAVVNGEEITRDEFVQAFSVQFPHLRAQAEAAGEEIDEGEFRQRTVENLVNRVLLAQEAASRGLSAPEGEVESGLADLARQYGYETTEDYLEVLDEQGLDADAVRAEAQLQVLVDLLIAEEDAEVEPTRQEVRAYYDDVVAANAGEDDAPPPLEQLRDQIVERLRTENKAEVLDALLETLRADADITVNV